MKLDAYLRTHGLTSAQFGEMSGIGSKQAVHKYRHGLRFPTPENLRRIRECTQGAVTADDFVDQHAGESPPPTEPTPAAGRPTAAPKRRKRTRAAKSTPPDSPPAESPPPPESPSRGEAA